MVSQMHQFKKNSNTLHIANILVRTWQEVEAGLRPIIGVRGVAALYQRTLYLTSKAHPWLGSEHIATRSAIDLNALKAAFMLQTDADAADAGNVFLETFSELLTTLVGTSLTKRLLSTMPNTPFSDLFVQEETQ